MPRAKPQPLNRNFKAKAHAWSSHEVVGRLSECLGGSKRLWQMTHALGRNIEQLDPKNLSCAKAIMDASGVLGTFQGAHAAYSTFPKKHGRPSDPALIEAIRQLRLIFWRRYQGKKWGMTVREHEFIETCLIDARLLSRGSKGLRYHLRTKVHVRTAIPDAAERVKVLEGIADSAEAARNDAEVREWPAEKSADSSGDK